MKDKLAKFFRILEIEFQDLEDGLEAYMKAIEDRYQKKEITQYVFKENDALLAREIDDVRIIRKRVTAISDKEYSDLDEAADTVVGIIENFTGIPEVVHKHMKGKVDKVVKYVNILERQH